MRQARLPGLMDSEDYRRAAARDLVSGRYQAERQPAVDAGD